MKKFMVILGVVCVLFCGVMMVGFTNNQEQLSHEDSLEAKNEEIKELQSELYDWMQWQTLMSDKNGDYELSQEEFEALVETFKEHNIELVQVVDDLHKDDDGNWAASSHYRAIKTYADGKVIAIDC